MTDYIAERKLLFSEKNNNIKRKLNVKITMPKVVEQREVKFPVDGIISVCHIELDGLNEHSFDVYGADSLQAVNMASNIEDVINRLNSNYDFFWATGEPYFD